MSKISQANSVTADEIGRADWNQLLQESDRFEEFGLGNQEQPRPSGKDCDENIVLRESQMDLWDYSS